MKIKYSLPIFLTLFRLLVVPPFFIFLIPLSEHNPRLQLLLLGLFFIAALTDYFDGFFARRWRQESFIGTLLDPFADKVFLTSVLIPLVAIDRIPPFVAYCIILRELWVTALRESAGLLGKRINVTYSGKIKTCLQLLYVGWIMALPFMQGNPTIITVILMFASIIVTLYSGYEYTRSYISFLYIGY